MGGPYGTWPSVVLGSPPATALNFAWTAPAVDNYDLDYSPDGSTYFDLYNGSGLSYPHSGLTPGHTCYYRFRAGNASGWSEWNYNSGTTSD